MMRYIAICDDEPLHLEYTSTLIQKILPSIGFEVDSFSTADSLLQAMNVGDYCPDVAILDIRMDGFDGIDLAKELNARAPSCKIIFLTSYLDYATEVYEAEHIYFVLKSDMEHRLVVALKRALESSTASDCIQVKQTKGTLLISINQILFLERKGRKTRIQTEDAEVQTTQPPQELLTTAPSEQFIRCHQSYWVQTQKILALKNNDFYLQNDYRIPLSRTYRQKAKEQFFASLKNLSLFNE